MGSGRVEINDLKLVNTVNGSVRGQKCTTIYEKKTYYAFRGIPYAKPPINELRFKPPQKPDNWLSPLDTFEFRDNCFQTFRGIHVGSEDCLYLNVFTPTCASPKTPLPVVVNIHGGSFTGGDGNIYGPDLVLNKDVVLVSFNYRVGIFGFLALGTSEYSGNMGLKDQVLALKWVQTNIQNFGGDPMNVTIFGISAGGASVHYHLLSPVSRGLFRRAICSSGCALNPWSLKKDHQNHISLLKEKTFNCGYPIRNLDDLIEFLRTVDGKLLSKISEVREYTPGLGRKAAGLLWLPVVEPIDANEPFLTRTPTEILADNYRSDIDLFIGYTSAEMMMYSEEILHPELLVPFDRQFEIELPLRELSVSNYTSKEYKEMAHEIRMYYFGAFPVCKETALQFINLLSDVYFVYGIDKAAKLHAEKSSGKTFYYIFNAESGLNLEKKLTKLDKLGIPGATHTDDACYIYTNRLTRTLQPDSAYTQCLDGSAERNIIENVTTLYMNFAKFGNPTPDNEPVTVRPITKDKFNYFEFVSTGVVTGVNPNKNTIRFWNNLLEKYKNLPK